MEPKTMQDRKARGQKHVLYNELVSKLKVEIPAMVESTLYLSTLIENQTDLADITHALSKLTPEDKLKIVFNSNGGLVSEGKILINTIQSTGVFTEFELMSSAASMAAVMFCVGQRRIIHENSSLMFHTFSGGAVGRGQEMKDEVKHKNKNILSFLRAHLIGLTDEELDKMVIGKEFWFDTPKMCKRGIATHVRIGQNLVPSKDYLKLLKKTKKIALKHGYDINSLNEAFLYGIDAITPLDEKTEQEYIEIEKKLSAIATEHELLLR